MANEDVTVLEADGTTQTTVTILGVGRQAAAASKSVAASTEDKAVLDAMAASLALLDNSIASGNELQVDVVAALPAGTNNIGDVDVLTINGVAPAFNSGNVGATVPRVTLATDDVAIASVVTAISASAGTAASPAWVNAGVQFVDVSMTTPTDAQDAGDVIAATQVVAACTRANDAIAVLHSAMLIDTDDVGVNIKMVVFSANTTLGTEDSAPDIDDTEALTVLGIVDFAAADYVDLGGSKYNMKTNIGLLVKPATGTDDIYVALYSPTGGTWASGVITLRLGFI